MDTITNSDDIIDSRDVIRRIAELEEQVQGALDETAQKYYACDYDELAPGQQAECHAHLGGELGGLDDDEREELVSLRKLAAQCQGYADWEHGAALIRESYFVRYAQEFAEDIGVTPKSHEWPAYCIDWEWAARELRHDYTEVDFDGITYLVR